MEQRNCRMVSLELGCTIWLIQEPGMKGNSPVAVWLAHGAVDTKVRIQISKVTVSIIEKNGRQNAALKQQLFVLMFR